jgi:hypothetical protein
LQRPASAPSTWEESTHAQGDWRRGQLVGRSWARLLFFLLFATVFCLTVPETATAQIWVSSKFTTGPGTQETATCTTTGTNPSLGGASPAPADYSTFLASCSVTPSTGSVITSSLCPHGAGGPPSGFPSGNPTATCSVTFQPMPGITYTLNSEHAVQFKTDPIGTSCGSWDNGTCLADPLGYYSVNPTGPVWPPMPSYTGSTSTNLVDISCSARGGTCTNQNMPVEVCLFESGDACTNSFDTPPYWPLATTSAIFALCPTPTVTSISPNVWVAGQSYNLTIMGTGFTTSAAATSACPVSTVGVTTPPTNPSVNVAVSAINVVSSTEITVTVNPTSAPYTGPPLKSPAPVSAIGATLEVAPTSSSGGPSPGASPALGTPEAGGALAPNVDVLLAPQILWNGNAIGGSGASAQSAVVGQQLALTTTPTAATLAALPVPLTLAATAPTTWTVTGGTNIGGYTPTSTSYSTGSVTPMPPLTTPNLTFYSVYPADPVDLTYTYCVTGQTTCPNADATFNVTGPSGGTLTGTPYSGGFTIQDWTAYGSCISPAGLYLEYGNYTFTSPSNCQFTGTPGIAFSANVQVQPPSGTAFPVQLVTGGSLSGGKNCTMSAGLDPAGYPYPNINDSPAVELLPTYTTQSRQESFQIYLMWAYSSNSPYIPVPIGYLPWNISGSASCSTSCGSASSWTPSTNSSGTSVGSYVPIQQSDMTPQNNFGYPIWGGPTSCN